MISYSILKTSTFGDLLLVADGAHLTGIYFSDGKHAPKIHKDWKHEPNHQILKQAGKQIEEYLAGKRKEFSVPMKNTGTEFQKKVWRRIAMIPFGKTVCYSDLAKYTGSSRAIRAAGTATGMNPLSIIIPCHRVIGKDGGIGGYAGGLDRKKKLHAIEGILKAHG